MVRMGDGRLPHDVWESTPPGLCYSRMPKMTLDPKVAWKGVDGVTHAPGFYEVV